MRLIVTGTAGLVGKRVAARLRAQGHEVIAIDVRSRDAEPMDFRSPAALSLIDHSIDGIIHLAAVSRVAWGEADAPLCEAINVEGTRLLLQRVRHAAPAAWFLFASSREIYGEATGALVREEDPLLPVNVYGRSKLDGETLVLQARAAGLPTAAMRLCNVYGGREDHPDRAVPALAQRAVGDQILRLTGADAYFDFVHVDDVVEGFLTAVELLAAGEARLPTVHLATGIATSLRALAHLAVDLSASASAIVEQEARSFDVSGFCGAPDLAERLLGWRAKVPLATGLADVIADLRAHGPLAPFPLLALASLDTAPKASSARVA